MEGTIEQTIDSDPNVFAIPRASGETFVTLPHMRPHGGRLRVSLHLFGLRTQVGFLEGELCLIRSSLNHKQR
jgi:hypothetical protein